MYFTSYLFTPSQRQGCRNLTGIYSFHVNEENPLLPVGFSTIMSHQRKPLPSWSIFPDLLILYVCPSSVFDPISSLTCSSDLVHGLPISLLQLVTFIPSSVFGCLYSSIVFTWLYHSSLFLFLVFHLLDTYSLCDYLIPCVLSHFVTFQCYKGNFILATCVLD
jgi:hypothetical protein